MAAGPQGSSPCVSEMAACAQLAEYMGEPFLVALAQQAIGLVHHLGSVVSKQGEQAEGASRVSKQGGEQAG